MEDSQGTEGMSTTARPNNNRNANNSMNAENRRDPSQNRDANYNMDSNKSRDDNDGGKTRKRKRCQQLQDYSNSRNTVKQVKLKQNKAKNNKYCKIWTIVFLFSDEGTSTTAGPQK